MAWFKNTRTSLVNTAKRMVAAKELKRGFDENYSVVKTAWAYNMHKMPTEPGYTMTHAQYAAMKKGLQRILGLFVIILIFSFLYLLVNLWKHHWEASFVSFAFFLLCLSFTFRYHFWLFQLKKQRIGLGFKFWYDSEIKGKLFKPSSKPGAKAA